MGAKFFNIELEVISKLDLSDLVKGLGGLFVQNYCGQTGEHGDYFLAGSVVLPNWNYEENGEPDAEAIGDGLCTVIEQLGSQEKSLWYTAEDRVFDIGLEANLDRRVVVDLLSSHTLARIAELGARLAVSVYTVEIENNGETKRS
jgi:hypothetical protein